jgi:hypothetical protein
MAKPTLSAFYQVVPYTDSNNITSPAFLLPPQTTGQGRITLGSPIVAPLTLHTPAAFQITAAQNASFQFANGQATIAATAWLADANSRTTLMNDFATFLQLLEAGAELANPATAPIGSAYAIGQSIADFMPCPVAESLYYRYSLVSGTAGFTTPSVDIRPGMMLRVDTEIFQTPGSGVDGYIGAGQFRYRVCSVPAPSGNGRVITFDPFLGTIVPPTLNDGAPSPAGGLIDLVQTANLLPYLRLFYPPGIGPSQKQGTSFVTVNPTLLGAPTIASMNAASVDYTRAAGNPTLVFLGRAALVPEIAIWIASGPKQSPQMEYVPVGTTLYHILERFNPSEVSLTSANITLGRRYYQTAGSFFFGPSGPPLLPQLDLPVMAGDLISFGTSYGV